MSEAASSSVGGVMLHCKSALDPETAVTLVVISVKSSKRGKLVKIRFFYWFFK